MEEAKGTVEAWQGRGEGTVEGEGVRGRDRDMVVSRHTASTAGAERTEETAMAVILSRGRVDAVGLVALPRAPMDTPLARQHTYMALVVVSDTRPRMDMVGLPARMVELLARTVGPVARMVGPVARTAGLVGLVARTAGLVGLLARMVGLPVLIGLRPQTTTMAVLATIRALLLIIQ